MKQVQREIEVNESKVGPSKRKLWKCKNDHIYPQTGYNADMKFVKVVFYEFTYKTSFNIALAQKILLVFPLIVKHNENKIWKVAKH